ncbi:MAG TPA: phosphodiesterase [Candidatus Ruania gallistercoris]|uniref:Phosphodiesterase n=1 Tax=Candidatus Ruania gallistercoris TaxID=2838746 RepID=A0A9D2EHH5_9MICO|nr:phosphodiesterase [Candidatus Ruania gallistercoris]
MTSRTEHLQDLRRDIERAGYYPALVADVLEIALAGEDVRAHLVHQETMFERTEVRRHITTLVLTPTRLVLAHVDDIPAENAESAPTAAATTEAVPLRQIRSVGLTHGVAEPATYPEGGGSTELTIALNWGAVRRIDLEPAACTDPNCEADHGLTGTSMSDDLVVRISAQAEGQSAMKAAMHFATELSVATAGAGQPAS